MVNGSFDPTCGWVEHGSRGKRGREYRDRVSVHPKKGEKGEKRGGPQAAGAWGGGPMSEGFK